MHRFLMKLLAIVVIMIVLAVSGGVAYAWDKGGGTGCDGDHGDGCQTHEIYWTSPLRTAPSASNVKCTIAIDPDSDNLIEGASNLAPGESCTYFAILTNTENQPVMIVEPWWTAWSWQPYDCHLFTYSDNVRVPPHSPPNSIAGGQSFAYQGTLSLSDSAGNACEGALAFFHVVIIAFPFERCSYDE